MDITTIYGNEDVAGVLKIAFANTIPTLLVGPTGSGKNTILKYIAQQHQRTDIIRLNLTGETTVDDLIGHYTIKEHSTVWQDGSVTHAVRNGNILVLDEVNAAQPEVLFALQSLLDDDRSITLSSHDNSVVKAHENFRVFATMNPTSGYAGTKSMNKAFMSRFGLVVQVNYAAVEQERALLQARVPGIADRDLLVMLDTAQRARRKLQDDELTYPLSTRDLLNWAAMSRELNDMVKAFHHTVVSKAESDGRELTEILKQSIAESDNKMEYVNELYKQIDKLSEELSGGAVNGRSLVREEADKAVVVLEKLQSLARDKEILEREALGKVKLTLKEARSKIKAAAEKVAQDAAALTTKEKALYQEGYEAARREVYEKLGLQLPTEAKE